MLLLDVFSMISKGPTVIRATGPVLGYGLVALLVCGLLAQGKTFRAQTVPSEARSVKLDEYGDLPTDDEAAHLDFFAEQLFKNPTLHGYILSYSEPRMLRGSYLRRIHGIGRYLSESRGIDANRLFIVDAGYKEKFVTQLWLNPPGAKPPLPAPTISQPPTNTSSDYKFDEECLNCSPAVGLYLYGLDEGLKFYAEALRKNPDSQGLIIVRPDKSFRVLEARKEARRAKDLLAKNHGLKATRINIKSGTSRKDGTAVAELWIVPRGGKVKNHG